MSNDKWYLVQDYTKVVDVKTESPKCFTVYGDKIFDVITNAKEKDLKISIYEVGECLIDWS